MFGRPIDKKRFSSGFQHAFESSKAIGKVLWGKTGTGVSDAESSSRSATAPRVIGPPLLPTETLHFIFELLWESEPPSTDIQNFRQACKLFNRIALEYIYTDVTVSLNEGGSDSGTIQKLIKHNKDIISRISRLHVTGFPAGPRRLGFISLKRPGKYSFDTRETSRDDLKTLLELLHPDQLTCFSITGRHILERIDKIPIALLFGKHSNLHQLCIPITLLFQHGVNTSEELGSVTIPSFQSLILTDLQYPRHIADTWTLLHNSRDTLKSLAIKSPAESELERYLMHRGYQGLTAGLPSTELSLRRIQDLHIEGFPYLDKVLECAPNLINFSNLRMLRLERCERADAFLLTSLGVYSTPKLKSLQLFETGSNLAFGGFIPYIGTMELETLVIALHPWEGGIKWNLIKEHLAGSLKRLWIQHLSPYHGPHTLLDMTNHTAPYEGAFFPHGWPKLEEVAIDPNYLEGNAIVLPETVKVCRIVGPRAQKIVMRDQPLAKNVEKIIGFRNEEGNILNVKVSAIGTLDHPDTGRVLRHPFFYNVTSELDQNGQPVSSWKLLSIDEAMKRVPDSHILWFERTDRPWSDKHGSFWY
ncbi:uncharacterized protein DFL_000067 [Arthrobotrys flagrans]|uniref:Uncharacterized protein n=1 Tax=Arthrobotrys flagrans TaxID=97331 RepID=A0A437ACR6_ARTFL|nr:hypothetical protein DFL_000067 [Arthrobotrys flagrans]